MSRRMVIRMLLVTGVGCGALDPEVGPPVNEPCLDMDSDPNRDVSFRADLLPLFMGTEAGPGCSCHQPTAPDPIGFEIAGLDLSSYAGLRRGGTRAQSDIVIAEEPCRSILYLKTGPAPPFGSRMPFDGPPLLSTEQRQMIADWIAEGAEDD